MTGAASALMTRTRPCRALDFDFVVEVESADLCAYLVDIFGGFPGPREVGHLHTYSIRRTDGSPVQIEVSLDGEVIDRFITTSAALAFLLWHLNRRAVAASSRFVLVHAGAVARRGPAIVLPAPMEAGKSTLVAGLLRAGFSYLTDEAAAIDPVNGRVTPYPKPVHLDYGSWPLFPDLAPAADDRRQPLIRAQWHVPPGRFGARVSDTVALGAVVFPRYERGVTTALTPMSGADALVGLIANSFNFGLHGAQGLAGLASVLEGTRCFRLAVGDLDTACQALSALDEEISTTTATGHAPDPAHGLRS